MTINDMLDEIFENLKSEIVADEPQADLLSENLLRSKVMGAYRDVVRARKYPKTYTESQIEESNVSKEKTGRKDSCHNKKGLSH